MRYASAAGADGCSNPPHYEPATTRGCPRKPPCCQERRFCRVALAIVVVEALLAVIAAAEMRLWLQGDGSGGR
jgi:hypothetical protein